MEYGRLPLPSSQHPWSGQGGASLPAWVSGLWPFELVSVVNSSLRGIPPGMFLSVGETLPRVAQSLEGASFGLVAQSQPGQHRVRQIPVYFQRELG